MKSISVGYCYHLLINGNYNGHFLFFTEKFLFNKIYSDFFVVSFASLAINPPNFALINANPPCKGANSNKTKLPP